uniref:C-type lectin domain-containing protein n=1 Tax=Acrobeloides nanus TaxID=290746 RepID=A0A914CDP9_9BILA
MVPSLVDEDDFFDDGTIITVNFNSANKDLTNLIRNITWVPYVNAQMYNFSSTSNTLSKDLEWAILQDTWMGIDPFTGLSDYPFYFGLHQNNQSQWSFYNYDTTEFPASSYINWSPGYPNDTDRCAVLDSNDGVNLVWKNYGCNTELSGLDMVLCQGKACDASSLVCCADCMTTDLTYEKKQRIRSKHRHIRKMKMVNGKPVRIG